MIKKVSHFEVTSDPSSPFAVTLDELKGHLRIDLANDDEDTELTLFLMAAEEKIACYLNIVIANQTVRGNFAGFEMSKFERYLFISFKKTPIQTFNTVEVFNGATFDTLATPDDWVEELRDAGFPRILFKNTGNLDLISNVDQDIAYPIRISADVGYATAGDVPPIIKNGILMYASFLFETRGDCSDGDGMPVIPAAIRAAISCHKIQETFG